VTDPRLVELINAEIDSELDAQQRAELARSLLADPNARARREDLRRLCVALDQIQEVEPPSQLRESVLAALQQSKPKRSSSSATRWRHAALVAGILAGGAVVLEVSNGPQSVSTDVAGTMAAPGTPALLDTVRLSDGPVSGRASLYRDRAGLGLELDVTASAPVDVLVTSEGQSLRIRALGGSGKPADHPARVQLTGPGWDGRSVILTFLMAGHQVGSATLRTGKVPEPR
jgi:hypothetical protein